MDRDIYVVSKNVYGRSLLYPDCKQSRLFCQLCGTETITPHMLGCISEMGFEVVERMVGNPALAVSA